MVWQRPSLHAIFEAAEEVGDLGYTSAADPQVATVVRANQSEGSALPERLILLIGLHLHAPTVPLPKVSRLRLFGQGSCVRHQGLGCRVGSAYVG